ncbi:bZIP transcription factor [Actinophytocola gossypii]|uniref:BZIP transcription factor n=1 Tax=Actinophytocola gossypii TaxID=2812003 RepID=A0ABT2JJ05_9PSEU|nr:bZIP transcription factor [Actinophytocola gossypii]MCT2587855.1 bZIP transcription factor [Actinophytocola gossypii]
MAGRVWMWLLEFAPTQEAVRREVKVAVDHVMDTTEDALTRQRERHRSALRRADERAEELRARVDELIAANAELTMANESLRAEVAEATDAARLEADREAAELAAAELEAAKRWDGASTDVFCCQSCWSFWFLSTAPDRTSCVVRGPFGRVATGCSVCAEPIVALPAAKGVVLRKQADDRISRPRRGGEEAASEAAIASGELAAIAEGLTRLPKVTSRTVAWVAADLTGAPELPATVLADIAANTTMPVPLDGIVAGIRAFIEVRAGRG